MKAEGSRDRAIEQLLRRSHAADRGAHASEACLDAETLAAWLDGGLDEQTATLAEVHASGCARCQALVGAMARSAPEVPASAPWWRSLRLGWLVPLAAGAAVVVLALIVPGYRTMSPVQERSGPPAAVAEAPRTTPPLPEPPRLEAPPADAPRAAAPRLEARREEAPRADAFAPTPAAAPAPATVAPIAPPPARSSEVPQLDASKPVAGQEVAAEKREAAVDQLRDNRQVLERDRAANEKRAAESTLAETVATAPPAPTTAAGAAPKPAAASERALGASTPTFRSAPLPLCGATWKQLPTNVPAELIAGSSPSASVCWVIGRGGVVLLSTDGRTWQRVPFPEPADLATVKAVDARTAMVTTTDGRTFRTTDAGKTWNRP